MAKFITSALGILLAEFSVPSLTEDAAITDVRPLTSYSWVEAKRPTIFVPRAPPTWKKNAGITKVQQDYGKSFIDQNAARMRSGSPLEPLFVAVEEIGKQDVLPQHQFICDRNTLRKLLKWANKKPGSKPKDFRIDIDLAGTTCLLTRVENHAVSFISSFRGYGHEYEKAATKWPAWSAGATAHHRIISPKLGGIPIVLRFEVDGCVSTDAEANLNKKSRKMTRKEKRANRLQPLPTSIIRGIRVKKSPDPLTLQTSLLEIKTRTFTQHRTDWKEVYPQIYLSQTPFLYIAKHHNDQFGPVEKHALSAPNLDKHAQTTKASVGKLKELLDSIRRLVIEHGTETGLTLVCMQGSLGLYRRKGGKEVSEEVLNWFEA